MNHRSQPPRTGSRRQRGSIVIYLALALVVFGVMAMAGAGRFGASIMGVSAPNCAAQARMMAESGVRYAMAYLRGATDQATLNARINDLNTHGPYSVSADLSFTVTAAASGTGAAMVSATGTACGGTSPLPSPATSASVNIPAIGGGGTPGEGISFSGGDTPGFIPTSIIGGSGAITVDASGSVTMGGNLLESSGSVWYSGSRDVCSNGNCTLGTGLRAYFDMIFSSSAEGDGFVWALMSAETNTNASSGGDASMGELMGYGGPGKLGLGIQPPKFGVEFDIYENSGTGSACNVGNRNDSPSDHMAFLFWGTENLVCSGKTQPATYDDNRHGAGAGTPAQPRNSANDAVDGPDNLGYYIRPGGNANWLQDGGQYRFRYELLRNTTPNAQNNYCYKVRAWMKRSTDTIAPGMDNTTVDYDSPPEMYRTFFLSQAMHEKMNHVFLGWTEGTGAATQLVTITNFALNFRGGTAAPRYSPPADYTAGWSMYEGSGTTVHNSNATNPADGVIGGSGTTWVAGLGCPDCSALDFNGSGYVSVPDNNSLDLTTAGSISLWLRVDNFVNNAGVLHKGQNSSFNDEAYSLQFSTNRRLRLYVLNAAGQSVFVQSSSLPNATGVWRHIAATWNATELKIYVDGALDTTRANSSGITSYNSAGSLVLGAQYYTGNTPGFPFTGAIDEAYLYKRVLTAAEIAALAVARP